jgi:hypothetical protein
VGQLADRFEFGPARILELKGKGPTPARVLLDGNGDRPVTVQPG